MTASNSLSWDQVFDVLEREPAGTILRLPKYALVHPADAGASCSVGLPVGQQADFRWHFADEPGLHARDFGTHYEAHIACCSPATFERRFGQKAEIESAAAIGGLIAMVVGKSHESMLAGMVLGALVAASATAAKK